MADENDPFAASIARMQAPSTADATPDPFAASIERMKRGESTPPRPPETGALEAFGAHAAESLAGPMPGVIVGAEYGAAAGAAAGTAIGGPGIGTTVGGVIGGLGGGIAGGWAGQKAQDVAMEALPSSWQESIKGELATTEKEHPWMSLGGALAPYALTMTPFGEAGAAERAAKATTSLGRVLANPWTARGFGGALQGGLELSNELWNGETPDWAKVSIATGFGVVFNRPNELGERIAKTARAPFEPARRPWSAPVVTEITPEEKYARQDLIANVEASGTVGLARTEETFEDRAKTPPIIEQQAQDRAATEASILGPKEPDLHAAVERERPDLVARRDDLEARLTDLRSFLAMPEATDDTAANLTRHLVSTHSELADVQRELAAVYRAAAERAGAETVPPHAEPSAEEKAASEPIIKPETAGETGPHQLEAAPAAQGRPLGEQKAFIADDVKARMIAAGWDAAVAEENGRRNANYWAVRAARLGGAEGTAEELYLRERADYAPPPTNGKAELPPKEQTTGEQAVSKADRLGVSNLIRAMTRQGATAREISHVINKKMSEPEIAAVQEESAPKALAQLSNETPEERALTVNDILAPTTEALKKRSRNVEDIAKDLMTRGAKALKGLGVKAGFVAGPEPRTDEMISRAIASEIQEALGRGGRTASDWYTRRVQEAMAVASAIHPEIGADEGHKFAFTSALAVTSQGETVASNVRLGEQAYSYFKEHGRFPTDIVARKANGGINANLARLNALIDELGLNGAREFMSREFTVRDLEKATGLDVGGENKDTVVRGSAILGPKIGQGFYQNLNGNYNPVTMDLWFMRAWGRITGTLVGRPMEKPRLRFEAALAENGRKVPKTIPALEKAADEIVTVHERDFSRNREAYDSGERAKSELVYAAERFLVNLKGINEQPTSGAQREWMRQRVARAIDILAQDQGINVTAADLQAIWWYPEKELYAKLGGRDSEAINVDYATALRDLARKKGVSDEAVDSAIRSLEQRSGPAGGVLPGAGETHEGEAQGIRLEQATKTKQGEIYISRKAGVRSIITRLKNSDASSIVHEEAHDWLEQMMRDSLHEKASGELRDDAQTVRDWLKIEAGEPIPRRAHERFARAWERYTWEGVVPSSRIARLFDKFTAWLKALYTRVEEIYEKAGVKPEEIPADIREVFDRMLTPREGEAVIAPGERAMRPTLGDIHQADVEEAAPGPQAEAASDRIAAEATRREQEHEPARQVIEAEAAAAERPGETEQRPGETGFLAEGGAEPAAGPAGGGGSARLGEELGRRGEGLPEGAGAAAGPAGERPVSGQPVGSLGPSAGQAGADARPAGQRGGAAPNPEPIDTFPKFDRDVYDPRGIGKLVARMNKPEDVKQIIRDAAEADDSFMGDKTRTISWDEEHMLTQAMGVDATWLLRREFRSTLNASQLWKAVQLVIQSAQDTHAAMRAAADGSDEQVLEFVKAMERHKMIQAEMMGARAEAGRALNIFRAAYKEAGEGMAAADAIGKIIQDNSGITLEQARRLAKLGAQMQTPGQIGQLTQSTKKPGFWRMVEESWTNGLISGLGTHDTYAIANQLLAMTVAGPETGLAAGIGRIRAAMGRTGTRIRPGEVGARFRTMFGTGTTTGARAAYESFLAGTTAKLPGERGTVGMPLAGGAGAPLAAAPELEGYGRVRGLGQGFVTGDAIMAAAGAQGQPKWGIAHSTLGAIPGIKTPFGIFPLGTILRMPSRAVAGIHTFFRVSTYSMDLHAWAYRTAQEASEAAARGDRAFSLDQTRTLLLTPGRPMTAIELSATISHLLAHPTEATMKESVAAANVGALMGPAGAFTQNLQRLVNTPIPTPLGEIRPLRFIDPFVQISSNVIKEGVLKRTPVGLLSQSIRDDLMGKNGNIAADMAASRMLVGSALAATSVMLAAQGYFNGSGPTDKNMAALWREAGNMPHSVRIGDMWYAVNRLGPLGLLMGIAADMYDVAASASEGDYLQAGNLLQHAFTQNILDESFLRGPADLIKAIEDPAHSGEKWITSMGTSFLPFSVGMAQLARAMDPYSRQARTFMDTVKLHTPGLSEQLEPRISIWGEPLPGRDAMLHSGITAIYEQRQNRDPVNIALLRLGIGIAPVPRRIRQVELTDQQWQDFARMSGRLTKQRLDALVMSDMFRRSPGHMQHDLIKTTVNQSREIARGWMMARWPRIVSDAHRQKMDIWKAEDQEATTEGSRYGR